ncbi:MAG TPA: Asp-tRNA(Asn)/Glu-tRNA(Gln) amidotransferase subunit GatB [Peptococcaceae bacterium]|nr:Asp-tRNA(Asn)/Glu-tRNA(Gln) amidotransferase subunit GatB [Peptococcaceae bacterium]
MTITIETVQHIAHLAKLQLSDTEMSRLADEMEKIVGFADKLGELDIEGVKPTTHAVAVHNVLRDDELKPSYDRGKILQNAPERDAACFLVPKVVE